MESTPFVANRAKLQDLPEQWNGFPVVDGDLTDLRYLDPKGGHVIGLRLKAHSHEERNKAIESGFAVLWQESPVTA